VSTALAVLALAAMVTGVWLALTRPTGSRPWKLGLALFGVAFIVNVARDTLDGPDPARSLLFHGSAIAAGVGLVVVLDWLAARRERRRDKHGVRLVSTDGRTTWELYGDWTPERLAAVEAELQAKHGGVLRRETF
jgi:hypothetical protein